MLEFSQNRYRKNMKFVSFCIIVSTLNITIITWPFLIASMALAVLVYVGIGLQWKLIDLKGTPKSTVPEK